MKFVAKFVGNYPRILQRISIFGRIIFVCTNFVAKFVGMSNELGFRCNYFLILLENSSKISDEFSNGNNLVQLLARNVKFVENFKFVAKFVGNFKFVEKFIVNF